jgi:hypothetical protein
LLLAAGITKPHSAAAVQRSYEGFGLSIISALPGEFKQNGRRLDIKDSTLKN